MIFVLLGIALIIATPYCVTAVSSSFNGMEPASYPKFVGWFTILIGVCQFVDSTLCIRQGREPEEKEVRDMKKEKKVLLIFILLVFYTWLCGIIGFCLASMVFVCAFLGILGVKKWWYYVIGVVFCFVIFYAFRYMLYIHLPRLGIWIL